MHLNPTKSCKSNKIKQIPSKSLHNPATSLYNQLLNQIKSIENQKSTRIYAQIQPNPPESNQSSSMPSKSSQTHPNTLPCLHASSEIVQIQYKSSGVDSETVSISAMPKCSCTFFKNMKEKEVCMHIIWELLYVIKIPEEDELLQQIGYTRNEVERLMAA